MAFHTAEIERLTARAERLVVRVERILRAMERPKRWPRTRLVFVVWPVSMWLRHSAVRPYYRRRLPHLLEFGALGVVFLVSLPFLALKPIGPTEKN
jgi:hypothetical protein